MAAGVTLAVGVVPGVAVGVTVGDGCGVGVGTGGVVPTVGFGGAGVAPTAVGNAPGPPEVVAVAVRPGTGVGVAFLPNGPASRVTWIARVWPEETS